MKITKFQDIPRFTAPGHYVVDYSFNSLIKWVAKNEEECGLNLNPDFQRGHIWTEAQQIKYIEFLLRGGTTGRDLYFNYPSRRRQVKPGEYNEFVCVDGLQRITAIRRFIDNEIKVFGSYYSEYTDSLCIVQRDIVHVYTNDLKTRREVLQWYIEMNSGGTPHTDGEIERVRKLMDDEDIADNEPNND